MPESTASSDALLAVAQFRKSRRSDNSGSCVDVATNLAADHHVVLVRDTKAPGGGVLAFGPTAWQAFLGGVRDGEFDV